jgi:DNA polymerase III subunit delta'
MQTSISASSGRGQWPVYGHTWAVELLQKAVVPPGRRTGERSGPNHAYLFLGPPQIGKSTLAVAFARALLCEAESGRPCGACRACQLMARSSHPDFQLVQPTDTEGVVDRQKGVLRAERANELIRDAALRPMEGQWRIFLIQDAHTANASFSNKMLKTLEEPPDQSIFLLTALDRKSVLPTTASRCQVLDLRPLDAPSIEMALQVGWQATPQQAQLLARLANGRLGWAVEQVRDPARGQQRLEQLAALRQLMAADRIERLAFAETLAASRNSRNLFGLLEVWTTWWRDVMLVQAGCFDACANVDQEEEIHRQARLLEQARVREFMHTLQRIEGYLHHTVNTRLALDVLVLKLPVLQG